MSIQEKNAGGILLKHRFSTIWPPYFLLSQELETVVIEDLLIVGWVDGKVTAHSPHDGSILWENQTDVELFGITGQMAQEDDRIIVPTRTGVASFCLANGAQLLEVDTGNVGWRNGVSITKDGYVIGDESGHLHTIARNGTVSTTFLGEGKIRHAPIETRHGLFVHMQTNTGSSMYLNGTYRKCWRFTSNAVDAWRPNLCINKR